MRGFRLFSQSRSTQSRKTFGFTERSFGRYLRARGIAQSSGGHRKKLRRGLAMIIRPAILFIAVPAVGLSLVFLVFLPALALPSTVVALIGISAFGAGLYYMYELYRRRF